MSNDHHLNDAQKSEQSADFEQIKCLYLKGSTENPAAEIDQQILAAARREMDKIEKPDRARNSIWRGYSRAFYVFASFALVALGVHWNWPQPARVIPGTAPAPVSSDSSKQKHSIQVLPGLAALPSESIQADKERWMNEIVRLFKEGDIAAAQSSVRAFKNRYPEYPIEEKIAHYNRP